MKLKKKNKQLLILIFSCVIGCGKKSETNAPVSASSSKREKFNFQGIWNYKIAHEKLGDVIVSVKITDLSLTKCTVPYNFPSSIIKEGPYNYQVNYDELFSISNMYIFNENGVMIGSMQNAVGTHSENTFYGEFIKAKCPDKLLCGGLYTRANKEDIAFLNTAGCGY